MACIVFPNNLVFSLRDDFTILGGRHSDLFFAQSIDQQAIITHDNGVYTIFNCSTYATIYVNIFPLLSQRSVRLSHNDVIHVPGIRYFRFLSIERPESRRQSPIPMEVDLSPTSSPLQNASDSSQFHFSLSPIIHTSQTSASHSFTSSNTSSILGTDPVSGNPIYRIPLTRNSSIFTSPLIVSSSLSYEESP